MKKVEIITIGDELLIGQVVDTNSAWMAQQLNQRGLIVYQITSVHDDRQHILTTMEQAVKRADVVLLTGGLGPTKDDITKTVLCEFFGDELEYRQDIREHLEQWYKDRPAVLNRLTDQQCLFPKHARLIHNAVGSAQGMLWQKEGVTVVSMPGVPKEMMYLMEHGVLDAIADDATSIVHHTVSVRGIPESALAILIEDWETHLPASMHLAYLPKDGTIRLRLSGYEVSREAVEAEMAKVLPLIQPYIIEE